MTSAPPHSPALSTTETPRKATVRDWIGLAVIALPCLVYSMDMTVLNLALPAISADLAPSSSQLLWMIDIYGFGVAGFLITMGTLGDRIGRRKLLMIGAAAFAIASAIAAFSNSASMLIAMRALLGVAGATLAPSTLSLIRNIFHDEHERQFAIGIWIAAFSMGAAVGPLVGGVLLQFFWWGSVFLAAIPVMALLLVLGPRLLPEYRDPNAGKLDLASVALSLVSVLSLVYAFKQMAEHGFEAGLIALAVLGAGVGWLFVRRQRGLAYPLLDMTLFSQPAFGVAVAVYGLAGLTMFGVYIFITQYLQGVLGLSALNAGLATVPWALGFMGGSLFTGRLTRWMPPTSVLVWGCALAALGFALIAVAHGTWALGVMVAGMVVMSLGMAPVITVINEIIITSAPPERAGSASALSETSGEFSGALGVAIFGSLGMAFYRHGLAEAAPAGLPEATLQVSLATLGGAVSAAHALPGPMGEALLTAARQSFSHALQLTAAIGAVLLVIASVVSARVIQRGASRPPAD